MSENRIDPAVVDSIAHHIFQVVPMLKRRVAKLSALQEEQGMPMSHMQVLSMLEEVGSMSVTEISRRYGIAKPNITPLVDRLVAAGLVDRVRNAADRRVVNIVILDAGREKLKEIRSTLNEYVNGWADSISLEDYYSFERSLSEIVRVLERVPV